MEYASPSSFPSNGCWSIVDPSVSTNGSFCCPKLNLFELHSTIQVHWKYHSEHSTRGGVSELDHSCELTFVQSFLYSKVSSRREWLIFQWTRTFPLNLRLVWRVRGKSIVTSLYSLLTPLHRAQTEGIFTDILHTLGLSLVEFQAPLFCSLAISPILLFRTCQLQSSRFGRHFYLSVSQPPTRLWALLTRILSF